MRWCSAALLDEYESDAALAQTYVAYSGAKDLTTKNLRVRAVVLVDGMVAGFWKLAGKKVVVEPVRKLLKREQAAVDEEASRLAAFAS